MYINCYWSYYYNFSHLHSHLHSLLNLVLFDSVSLSYANTLYFGTLQDKVLMDQKLELSMKILILEDLMKYQQNSFILLHIHNHFLSCFSNRHQINYLNHFLKIFRVSRQDPFPIKSLIFERCYSRREWDVVQKLLFSCKFYDTYFLVH